MSFFKEAPRKREELELPRLHYIVADDWMDKLGMNAFRAWLKMHTWVDRKEKDRPYDKIPYTLESTWEKLGISKKTFYQTVLKPLWEYGLIDVVEYAESERKTQKPKNIIVYPYPANIKGNETKPLEKMRDYEHDYNSNSQIFGRMGGRPKKEADIPQTDNPTTEEEKLSTDEESHGFKIETMENGQKVYRFKKETVQKLKLHGFKKETVHGFKKETVTVSKRKPNNSITNKLLILPNKNNKPTNNLLKDLKDINIYKKENESETDTPFPNPLESFWGFLNS